MIIWELLICVIGTVFTAYLANERRRGDLMALALLSWPAALIWLFLIWRTKRREREIEHAIDYGIQILGGAVDSKQQAELEKVLQRLKPKISEEAAK